MVKKSSPKQITRKDKIRMKRITRNKKIKRITKATRRKRRAKMTKSITIRCSRTSKSATINLT
jgi:hypothetical protein